jgi:tetratricopeptide (TPR) repeat protein
MLLLLLSPALHLNAASTGRANLPLIIQRADDFYLGRQNLDNISKAVAELRQAVSNDPNDYESWWRIAKFHNYWARHAPESSRMKLLNDGVDAAKKATALQPKRVEGHFWLGANYGVLAEEGNLLTGFRLIDPIRSEMEAALRIDPDYEEGSGRLILARVYFRAPFFKGGSKNKAMQLLEEADRHQPDNSMTLLYLADCYLSVGKRDAARQRLERILAMCPDPDYGPELADNQAEARKLLARNFHERP